MSKERFLTVLIPIKDSDCILTSYDDMSALTAAIPPSLSNINKIYKVKDGTYCRVWENPTTGVVEYHAVIDREFPYLGEPLEIYDFTYDATRMGTAPTISAQGLMWFAIKDSNGKDETTLDGLWTQKCHVVFNGENLYLKQIPTSSKSNEDDRYKYDLDFVDESVVLERVYLYDIVSPFITDKPISESSTFGFYGDVQMLADRINSSMIRSGLLNLTRKYVGYPNHPNVTVQYLSYEQWNQMNVNGFALIDEVFTTQAQMIEFYNDIFEALDGDYNRYLLEYIYVNENGVFEMTGFKCIIGTDKYGEVTTSEEKFVSFDKNTIYEALQQVHDTFELEYYITKEKDGNGNFTGNTLIIIGDCEHDFADVDPVTGELIRDDEGIPTTESPFDYGVDDELLSKEKTNTTDKIVTRITGVGSTENIPWHYPNPSPDGWIKPYYTRYGEELPNVTIDYPTDEGSTVADAVRYEKYLKNRIGISIKRGLLKGLFFTEDYYYGNTSWGATSNPSSPFPSRYTMYSLRYLISTTGITQPSITLELDYDSVNSNMSLFMSKLYDVVFLSGLPALFNELGSYYSYETYPNPTAFQTMFQNRDGRDAFRLISPANSKNFFLDIYYIVPSDATFPTIFDYSGYLYPSVTVQYPDLPSSYTDPYGHTHEYYADPAYIGEDFYEAEELVPFVSWSETVYPLNQQTGTIVHYFTPSNGGYSTDGTEGGAKTPIARRVGYRYKDITSETIYTCLTDEIFDVKSGVFTTNVFTESSEISMDTWLRHFVSMKLGLYESTGWYIGSTKIELADYGIDFLSVSPTMFDAIEFKRVKWVTPQQNLMPEVFIKTDGERRFYNAHNYWDKTSNTLYVGTADTAIGESQVDTKVRNNIYKAEEEDPDSAHYEFESEYDKSLPHEHIEDFEDVKPSINGQKNHVAVEISAEVISDWANQYQNYFTKNQDGTYSNATSTYDPDETYYVLLRIDVVEMFGYDETDNNEIWENSDGGSIEGEYKHPYFFAKLRPMGFNIFDLALQEDMVLSMTTGNCGACNFKIGVDENSKKNPVQIWEYDVYSGEYLSTATLMYEKGTLRRYVDLTGLYYDTNGTQEGYRPIKNMEGVLQGDTSFSYSSGIPIYQSYNYTAEAVKNGYVGTMKNQGTVHFEGDVVTNGKFIASQQDTSENYVWVALMKDTETYGNDAEGFDVIMPSAIPNYNDPNYNQYIRPKSIADVHIVADPQQAIEESTNNEDEENADKFVLTNIRLPMVYIRRAEHELSRELVKYMYEHNAQKFNFSIKFSRIYIEENEGTDENLNENSVLYVLFNGKTYRQYVKHYSYKMSHGEPLPEINVDMNEELSVTKTISQQWDAKAKKNNGKLSAAIGSVISQVQSRFDKTAMKKDGTTILSGNIIVDGENTSIIEMARRGGGGYSDIEAITEEEIDAICV